MSNAEDLLREVEELLSKRSRPPAPLVFHPEPEEEDLPPPMPPPEPASPRRRRSGRRRRGWRRLRIATAIILVIALAAAATVTVLELGRRGAQGGDPRPAPGRPTQEVLVWLVWQRNGPMTPMVTVLTSGQEMTPFALAIPPYTATTIPGHGFATVGESGQAGDADLVSTTVENLLQVRVNRAAATTTDELVDLVDAVGGVATGEGTLSGDEVLESLRAGGEDSEDLRFVQWQEVLTGLMAGLERRPAALEAIPEDVRPLFEAVASRETSVLELPVQDIGSGLARADADAVARLVQGRFVTSGRPGGVRLVILNGNGIPGIGERVARVLVPAGFRLVSSLNAPTFDVKTTRIVASTEDFLDAAERVRELLGTGKVFLAEQPSRVADVSVVVGRDIGGR